MNFLNNLKQQLSDIWQEMSTGRRIVAASLFVLLVVGIGVTGYWAASTEYRVLFSQLGPADAGNVTSALKNQNVDYKLDNNGTTILVPEDQVSKARIDLAMQGLPANSGKGWELLEEQSALGMTPQQQERVYKLALEGELARSIMTLEPVDFARVHLVIPQKRLIRKTEKPAKGTAILRLKAGRSLDRRAVEGIQRMVAGAVEGLDPQRVALLSSTGKPLSGAESGLGAVQKKMEHQEAYEKYLTEKVQTFLNDALGGVGRAVVQVNAKLDYAPGGTSSIIYDPEAIARKMEIVRGHKKTQRGRLPSGVAGTAPNLPNTGIQNVSAGSELGNSDEDYSQAAYAVSRVMKWEEREVGTLKHISVGAVVDLRPRKDKDGKPIGKQLTLAQVESLIRETTGLVSGVDTLTVVEGSLNLEKDLLPSEAEISEVEAWKSTLSLIRSGAIGLLALVLLILGVMLLRGVRKRQTAQQKTEELDSTERIAQRVSALAETDPEILGQVLSTWLEQSDEKEVAVAASR